MSKDEIRAALHRTFSDVQAFASEAAFQVAFARALGNAQRELPASFRRPALPPRCPPRDVITELASRRKPIHVPPEGRDPCPKGAKLDVLWLSPQRPVPIELKYRTTWKSDTYGYMFLKDLHRSERVHAAGVHVELSEFRYAIFVTTESVYWEGRRPEPQPFWLRDGSRIQPGQWIQYDQPSPDTQWWRYPPFHLAHGYEFHWEDLGPAGRFLLVEVNCQDDDRR